MVNFRYHLVSLIAVFLALVLGILMGSTVIDQGIVSRLERQTSSLEGRLDNLQAQNDTLRRQQDVWETFGRTSLMPTVKDRLRGRSIVLVVQDGADSRMVDGVSETLTDAGATLAGRVDVTDKWALRDDATRNQLASAVASPSAQAAQLYQAAAGKIAARLSNGSDPTADGDLLRALREAGFLRVDPTGAGAFPPGGTTLVVVASGTKDARPPHGEFFVPLLRALDRNTVVTEPFACADSLAERVRSDAALRSQIATVDDADLVLGRVAVVSAIRALSAGLAAQHLGARRSATALVPQPL